MKPFLDSTEIEGNAAALRDRMGREGGPVTVSTLQRIVQRDGDRMKRERARELLAKLTAADDG